MAFGLEDLRQLIERFISNSGGRRGRGSNEARKQAATQGPGQTGLGIDVGGTGGGVGESGGGGPAVAGGPAQGSTAGHGDAPGSAEPSEPRRSAPDLDDLDDDDVVDELYHRLENLEDELERKDAMLNTIQDSQETVAERVEDVGDTIRRLLGVYDRLTNDVNPFTDEGEKEGGFGIFAPDGDSVGEGFARAGDEPNETVSFADLKEAIEEAAEDETAVDEREESAAEDDTVVEVQATDSVDPPDEGGDSGGRGDDDRRDGREGVTLGSLAPSYATDVLVFEWLTELVHAGGPAATLRAISYYHEIGWIEHEVKEHLEGVLSGPDIDMHVDPQSTPQELTAEDHADSYTYIMKLDAVHDTLGEMEV